MEIVRLSRAIAARRLTDGNYAEIIAGAKVRQPVVSLALHRRLVLRTESVDRLFEYLGVDVAAPAANGAADALVPGLPDQGMGSLMQLVAALSDGSDGGDHRLASLLKAIRDFASEAPAR